MFFVFVCVFVFLNITSGSAMQNVRRSFTISLCKETHFIYTFFLKDFRISIANISNLTFYIGKLIIEMFEYCELFSIHSLVTI